MVLHLVAVKKLVYPEKKNAMETHHMLMYMKHVT